MKGRNESASQSLKTLAVATFLVVMLLNLSLLLPISPVRAESEEPACASCSCCQQSVVTETFHHITVNVVNEEILLQMEPLVLPETGCAACNSGCLSGNELANVQFTMLEQEDNLVVSLVTYTFSNGTTVESTITVTLLWSYDELSDGINRTARFTSTEITAEDSSLLFYRLSYSVHGAEYNLTLRTELSPLNSEAYGSSFTIMNYVPAQNPEVSSFEFIEINSSVTLSQLYTVLGHVAKEIGKLYEESGNETITQLAENYYNMREESKNLSKLIEQQLPQYNHEILRSSAIIRDMLCPGGEKCDGGGGGGGTTCTFECWFRQFLTCFGYVDYVMAAAIFGCAVSAIACLGFWPICFAGCMEAANLAELLGTAACAFAALFGCCL